MGRNMECKDCKYLKTIEYVSGLNSRKVFYNTCEITHICNPKSCEYITSDEEVKDMNICYNCNHWVGGGDWGLSCTKNYYNCNSNGFDAVCEKFER